MGEIERLRRGAALERRLEMAGEKRPYGWNDGNTVFCAFCDWKHEVARGMEEMEFVLRKHLKEKHDKPLLYRIERGTDRRTEIP